jgi:nucleotide-binding universal stress UspA family protein
MQEVKRILVATDLSPASEPALRSAAALAIRMDAALLVLHVLPERELEELARSHQPRHPVDLIYSDLEVSVREQYRRAVPDEVRRFLHTEVLVVPGVPAEEIGRTAALKGADLIVTGTHGRTGVRRVLMGSVAEQVLRTASCPVLTVRPLELREAA